MNIVSFNYKTKKNYKIFAAKTILQQVLVYRLKFRLKLILEYSYFSVIT